MRNFIVLASALVSITAWADSPRNVCNLGNSFGQFLKVKGDTLVFSLPSGQVQVGTKLQASRATPPGAQIIPNATYFGNFTKTSDHTFLAAGDEIAITNATLNGPNLNAAFVEHGFGVMFTDKCHEFGPKDTERFSCLGQVEENVGPIDGEGKPDIRLISGENTFLFRQLSNNAANNDRGRTEADYLVTTRISHTQVCQVRDVTPENCAAVVADAANDQASKDGRSAGSPFVQQDTATTFTAGVHDPESGEFIYNVVVSLSGTSCRIVSLKRAQ